MRLCEFSGSVIMMEYIPLSLSVGSITCESINQLTIPLTYQLFISTLIHGLKKIHSSTRFITIIKLSDKKQKEDTLFD